jgi:hypothetical protein
MAGIIKINKHIQYQSQYAIYFLYAGETRPLEFIKEIFASHIVEAYLKDGTLELFQSNEIKQEMPVVENQDDAQQTFEIMYKTTQSIQDKDGNEIEVGSQFTESELKEIIAQDKRQSKKRVKDLLEEEKVMEVKIVK